MDQKPKAKDSKEERGLFGELMSGIQAMTDYREGRLTLRAFRVLLRQEG